MHDASAPPIETQQEKEADLWLAIREAVVGVCTLGLFLWLILVPGRAALRAGDASTVAVLADAATAAAMIGVPFAVIVGGSDLIRWIVRQVLKARRREPRTVRRPGAPGYAMRGTFAAIRQQVTPRRASYSIVVVIALGLAWWGLPRLLDVITNPRAPVTQVEVANEAPEAPTVPARTLPSYCASASGAVTCAAGPSARSAEDIGIAVCGQPGLGREIFNTNRDARGFTFDEYHVPPGTQFSVQCPHTED